MSLLKLLLKEQRERQDSALLRLADRLRERDELAAEPDDSVESDTTTGATAPIIPIRSL